MTDSSAILLSASPPNDAGAETADRYHWQAMMATADVLSLYLKKLDSADVDSALAGHSLVCEHHEDWALIAGPASEIVSGKHREASVGPFSTYRQILDKGGVLHLFDRWQALERSPDCRLVTTAGLADYASKLKQVCGIVRDSPESQDELVCEVVAGVIDTIRVLKTSNGTAPDPESDATVRAFLASLSFQDSEPRRDHLPDMAAERYGRPIAVRLGQPNAGGAVWQATLGLVSERMRAAGPSRGGALPTVLGQPHDHPLARRSLTLADADTAIRFAILHANGYTPLPRPLKANKMAVKMVQGGCSDNAIERADRLRLQYRRYWRGRRSNPSTTYAQQELTNLLTRVVDEATDAVRVPSAVWGAALWRELASRFQVLDGQAAVQGMSADLLLGGVSELANNCQAWYTDRFDVEQLLQELLTGEVAS